MPDKKREYKMKLIKTENLGYSLCNTSADLSALGAFQLVEDAICEMMGMLKLDGETCMREYDAMWVFVKNRIEIYNNIHWMDEFITECYITMASGVKLVVDTVIKSHGKIAVASRAELCAIDHTTQRIRRSNTVGINETTQIETPEINICFNNMDFCPNELSDKVVVRSSDLDFYHHTNNVSYIRYIINQYPDKAKLNPTTICGIEIRYINQSFEGDVLEIYKHSDDNFMILCNKKPVVCCTVSHKI